jgi:hypothetical protein
MTPAQTLVLDHLAQAYPDASRGDLADILEMWEVLPYMQDGEMVGASMMRGSEFHCFTLPTFKLRRKAMREFLEPLFMRHGMLTTRVHHNDAANQRFNAAFGFRKTWSDEQFHYYMMTELPFGERKQSCLLSR